MCQATIPTSSARARPCPTVELRDCARHSGEIPHRAAARDAARFAAATDETPKPGDKRLARATYRLSPSRSNRSRRRALRARAKDLFARARRRHRGRGVRGGAHACRHRRATKQSPYPARRKALKLPALLLSAGETTVTFTGAGRADATPNSFWRWRWASRASPHPSLACDTDASTARGQCRSHHGPTRSRAPQLGPRLKARLRA